jgi:LacI family transcriptional regulator, repressor for deo operon, udp, cdd, tsx, nupC, and nupG
MSTATVSRALRGLAGVSEETRERVMESARRLGYVASPSAAGLASGQTRTVAVIVPMVTRWFFAAVVQGAEEVLREHGYDLLLYNLAGDASARHRVFETSLLTKRVDAVLVLSLKPSHDELARLDKLGRPVTIVGAEVPGWATVRIDDQEAARVATQHLVGLGHRRIGHIGGETAYGMDRSVGEDRSTAWRAALERHGITPHPSWHGLGQFLMPPAKAATMRMLHGEEPPTAIFAGSDEMAFGVLVAAAELGLRVPEDLSVIGIDDHDWSESYGLTTIRQDPHEQGRTAARTVLDALAGVESPILTRRSGFELVLRRSTGPLPRG